MNSNGFKMIGVVGVFAVVLLLGVVWANYTQDLEIDGTGTVKSSTWNVGFTDLSEPTLKGTAAVITEPSLTATKIGDYAVQLMTPGDSVSYTIEIKNSGSYAAKVSSVTVPTPTCTGSGDTAETDANNVCKYLTYTLTYEDGNEIKIGDTLAAENGTAKMLLKLTYSADVLASELPKNDVTISNLTIPMIYIQG